MAEIWGRASPRSDHDPQSGRTAIAVAGRGNGRDAMLSWVQQGRAGRGLRARLVRVYRGARSRRSKPENVSFLSWPSDPQRTSSWARGARAARLDVEVAAVFAVRHAKLGVGGDTALGPCRAPSARWGSVASRGRLPHLPSVVSRTQSARDRGISRRSATSRALHRDVARALHKHGQPR